MSHSKRLKIAPKKSRNFTCIIIIALKRNSTKNSSQTTSREKIGLKKLKFVQIPISHSTLEMLGKNQSSHLLVFSLPLLLHREQNRYSIWFKFILTWTNRKKGETILKMQQTNTMQLLKIQKSHQTNANTLDCKKTAHQYNRSTCVQNVVKRNNFYSKK